MQACRKLFENYFLGLCPIKLQAPCTYARWFARPAGFQLCALLMQRLSACCMRVLLHFRMGTQSLPINIVQLGRRSGIPRDRRLGQHCTLHAAHDEKHLLLECCAMQNVRDCYPAFFSPVKGSCTCGSLAQWGSRTSSWTRKGRALRHGLF